MSGRRAGRQEPGAPGSERSTAHVEHNCGRGNTQREIDCLCLHFHVAFVFCRSTIPEVAALPTLGGDAVLIPLGCPSAWTSSIVGHPLAAVACKC
jgi:hypothetical protein